MFPEEEFDKPERLRKTVATRQASQNECKQGNIRGRM